MKRLSVFLLAFVVASPALAAVKSVTFEVAGWTCATCAASTRIALKKLDGVQDAKTDHKAKETVVTYEDTKVTPDRMIQTIERIGYKAKVKSGLSAPATAAAQPNQAPASATASAATPAERFTFFEVPLECYAAEGLGCGSLAKPILRDLEKNELVAEARINYPGTVLVVVWKDPSQSGRGVAVVESAFGKQELETSVLRGAALDDARKEFQNGRWYRADEVDRLSEREAEIIAARLVGRLERRIGLSKQRAAALTKDLSAAIAKNMTAEREEECEGEGREVEFTKVAQKHLNEAEMAELRKAAEEGIAALPGEPR